MELPNISLQRTRDSAGLMVDAGPKFGQNDWSVMSGPLSSRALCVFTNNP